MSVFVLVCIAVALASFLAVALIAMSGRNRDWAKAQRTIHNLKAQEASLVEQLRHANAEAERLEAERASWERTSRHYETLAGNAGLL